MSRSSPKSPSPTHRLERVGELIRHAMSEILARGDVLDDALERHPVTVLVVRMSPDLKVAIVSVMPLGGRDAAATIDALNRHKKELRTLIARKINLKFAPDLRFTLDSTFDAQERIDVLLRSPEVARDLAPRDVADGDGTSHDRRSGERGADRARARDRRRGKSPQRRSTRVEVNGWINLDKPVGVSSTQAVGRLKFLFNAKKAGHAGTLDPLASGVLPVAFGEATKTVPIVQDGAKAYRFRVRWGEESATDDAEGAIVARSDRRPSPAEIEAALPRFIGLIEQTPPTYSAIKIDGARAYDLAREGETFAIAARPIHVYRLALVEAEVDTAVLEAECGKGAYVRAIAATLAGRSAATVTSLNCGARGSGPFRPTRAFRSTDFLTIPN